MPSTTSVVVSADEEQDLDIGLDVVDHDEDQDANGDLITTPGSSTTGKNSSNNALETIVVFVDDSLATDNDFTIYPDDSLAIV